MASRSRLARSSELSKLFSTSGTYSITSFYSSFTFSFFISFIFVKSIFNNPFLTYFVFFAFFVYSILGFWRFFGQGFYWVLRGLFLLFRSSCFYCCYFCFFNSSFRLYFISFREVNYQGILYLQFFDTNDKYLFLSFANIFDSDTVNISAGFLQYRKV